VANFCESTFGVKFPMFAKSRVAASAGDGMNPLFAELARRSGTAPQWNFHKYLIARDGSTVVSRVSNVDPQSRGFIQDIEKLLDAK
jgi:glutathione peroxidase